MPMPRNSSSGYSIISLLAALAITTPILLALGSTLHRMLQSEAVLNLRRAEMHTQLVASHLLNDLVQAVDSHRFAVSPIIHRAGRIAFTDGSPNPVAGSAHPPSSDSDAITALKLDINSVFDIKICLESDSFFLLRGCSRFAGRTPPNETANFLAISIDGLWELKGEMRGHKTCRDFALQPVKSMAVGAPVIQPACPIMAIVPIQGAYTLYIDRTRQLRYLAHRGETNIENQPVVRGVKALSLSAAPLFDGQIMSLSAEIIFNAKRKTVRHYIHHLGRTDYLNFILNR